MKMSPGNHRDLPTSVEVDGITLPVEARRRRVKNLNARLRGGAIAVSVPLRASPAWVREHLPRLARALLRRAAGDRVRGDDAALRVAREVARRFPAPPTVASVTFSASQTTLWGSCSAGSGDIRVSAVLRHMPRWVLEGVVAHELCHMFHRTHGPRFQALLRRVFPDARRLDGFLSGAHWHARVGPTLPPGERGPLGDGPPSPAAPAAPPPPVVPAPPPPTPERPRRPRRRPADAATPLLFPDAPLPAPPAPPRAGTGRIAPPTSVPETP